MPSCLEDRRFIGSSCNWVDTDVPPEELCNTHLFSHTGWLVFIQLSINQLCCDMM